MNMLTPVDNRVGVLVPAGAVLVDAATKLLFSNAATERLGHRVDTAPVAVLPISLDLATTTRIDFTQTGKDPGVLNELTVGPLPEAFGVSYG